MIEIIDIDASEVERGFDAMRDRAGLRSRDFFAEAKRPAKADIREHQRARRSPDGRPWPPRAASTLARAAAGAPKRDGRGRFIAGSGRASSRRGQRRRGGQLLGKLPGGSKASVDRDGLVLSWHARFAEAHTEGATVGRGVRLPARPFIGWSQGFMHDMHAAWLDYVARGWDRGR
ncbi:MAG: hypothetical protein AAGC55_05635 [Myxococcota bacterium]